MKFWILQLTAAFSVTTCLAQGDTKKADYTAVESVIEQWVQTEGLLSKEAAAWQEKKEHLALLSELFTEQIKELDEELAASQWDKSDFNKNKPILEDSLQQSEATRIKVIDFVSKTAPRVQKLSTLFPLPLAEELASDIAMLEQEVKNDNAREVLRAIINILQQAERFNRNFTSHEQDIVLAGETYRAQVIYLGLSCAFFKAGKQYGLGQPKANSWTFTLKQELASQIEKGFAIQQGQTPSALFKLPLQVKEVQP